MQFDQANVSALMRTLLRLAVIVCIVFLVNLGLNWLHTQISGAGFAGADLMLTGIVVITLVLYAILMAIPFVPGIEIAISLLIMQGTSIVPFIYGATFLGLAIAYLCGRYMPYRVLHSLFADLGLKSACRLLERLRPLDQKDRLGMLENALPDWLGPHAVRYRYVTLGLALNIPGNSLIGGGGGISLVAGLSHLFSTAGILLCFAIAVSPVPIAVFVFGIDVIGVLGR